MIVSYVKVFTFQSLFKYLQKSLRGLLALTFSEILLRLRCLSAQKSL